MDDTKRRLKHRFGQVATVGVLLFTLSFIPAGYDIWRAEPAVAAADVSSATYDFAVVLAIGIPLLVGFYLTRNIYQWSEAQRP